MTFQEIYNLAIKMGIDADLRSKEAILKNLKKVKEGFDKLTSEQKKYFDEEKLENPYSDTRILNGDPKAKIKTIYTGIDIDSAELMIARFMSRHSGRDIELVLSHHPSGKALAALDEVMYLQAEVLADYGVPINIAEGLMRPRISEVARGVGASNHQKAVDAARHLDFNFMCVHTPADNLVATYLKKLMDKKNPETIGEVMNIIKEIPEYKIAGQLNAGPKIFVGSEEAKAGKIAISEITGGTDGSAQIYEKMAHAGIGTIIGMHMKEEHKKQAQEAHINVVIAGHISSDSLGMNLFLDELEKKGIEIIPASGLIRVKRK
ncbi:MAG: NGG1p interacting factor NIF3 [Candidatus Portnoybacteria bacterium CG10_big_fil_rev_8_21_14_0_10_36_7]|uniref:NGG1p interacting factor NIF3 n=1 Tax=Candidatus Portnoybacteria bacterium CG10_big_fil_rev_8_21_14_0_10_36_7 TaxID=1974812 RepID=A0A2M8KD95_9BACT|nr:MAG: NGG1p interacting factor NIF3 [Candidatus Portnoybacteria bacterium CG10_big_fil_rev_8_21_14_0_10_36_7]